MILPTVSMQRFVTDGRKNGWMSIHPFFRPSVRLAYDDSIYRTSIASRGKKKTPAKKKLKKNVLHLCIRPHTFLSSCYSQHHSLLLVESVSGEGSAVGRVRPPVSILSFEPIDL